MASPASGVANRDTPQESSITGNELRAHTTNSSIAKENSGHESSGMAKPGEALPGWTIMKPLKKSGGSSAKSKIATTNSTVSKPTREEGDSKGNEELTIEETKTTVDGKGNIDENGAIMEEQLRDVTSSEGLLDNEQDVTRRDAGGEPSDRGARQKEYKTYKRKWFGLIQLVLLNVIVSWDWLSFAANSDTASQYYGVSQSDINWLSIAIMFAFVIVSPIVVVVLHRGGPKPSIVAASVLLLTGNWIRYGATRAGPKGNFGGVLFGQILNGLAQPFVLAAPTTYSELWFTDNGRVAATAVMSLANPLGGALAQLIDPFWAGNASDIPNMVLYVAIISSVATIPSFFIPAAPPTPCSASSEKPKQKLLKSIKFLFSSPEFYMIMAPYTIYVALFNSISSLINQILEPYSFSETNAGIAGALLIVIGLISAAIISPVIDRTKKHLLTIKLLAPLIGICYLAFTWAPQTRSLAAVCVILSVLGAASFSLVPVALEFLTEITYPVSPELTSTICWTGGQLFGGIVIVISDALRASGKDDGTADDGSTRPPGNMYRALVFQTVLAVIVVPLPLLLGLFGREKQVMMKRLELDRVEVGKRRTAEV